MLTINCKHMLAFLWWPSEIYILIFTTRAQILLNVVDFRRIASHHSLANTQLQYSNLKMTWTSWKFRAKIHLVIIENSEINMVWYIYYVYSHEHILLFSYLYQNQFIIKMDTVPTFKFDIYIMPFYLFDTDWLTNVNEIP